jgi:plastocyanin
MSILHKFFLQHLPLFLHSPNGRGRCFFSLVFCLCILPVSTTVKAEDTTGVKAVHEVGIVKFQFDPEEITVQIGDTVCWVNKEKRQYHSVWFEKSGEPEPDYFFPGETYHKVFSEVGDFPYRCGPHPQMTGMVHVIAADITAEGKVKSEEKPETVSPEDDKSKGQMPATETPEDPCLQFVKPEEVSKP